MIASEEKAGNRRQTKRIVENKDIRGGEETAVEGGWTQSWGNISRYVLSPLFFSQNKRKLL